MTWDVSAMPIAKKTVAIVFPADAGLLAQTPVERSRLADVAKAFFTAGANVVGAPYTDAIADETEARLANVDAVPSGTTRAKTDATAPPLTACCALPERKARW